MAFGAITRSTENQEGSAPGGPKRKTFKDASRTGGRDTGGQWHGFGKSGGGSVNPPSLPGGGNINLGGGYGGGGAGGGGGGGGVPSGGPTGPTFKTQAPGEMSEVMQMYRDLIQQNRDLAGEFDVEDLINKQRAEGSIQMREAEAMAGRTGGQSAAEKRNIMADQYRELGEVRGGAERGKLDFERGLLQDMAGAVGGAGGMAGGIGDFLNRARSNEIDVWNTMTNYPLRLAQIQAQNNASNAQALAQLSALV